MENFEINFLSALYLCLWEISAVIKVELLGFMCLNKATPYL